MCSGMVATVQVAKILIYLLDWSAHRKYSDLNRVQERRWISSAPECHLPMRGGPRSMHPEQIYF
jgi:hypothetical protein